MSLSQTTSYQWQPQGGDLVFWLHLQAALMLPVFMYSLKYSAGVWIPSIEAEEVALPLFWEERGRSKYSNFKVSKFFEIYLYQL